MWVFKTNTKALSSISCNSSERKYSYNRITFTIVIVWNKLETVFWNVLAFFVLKAKCLDCFSFFMIHKEILRNAILSFIFFIYIIRHQKNAKKHDFHRSGSSRSNIFGMLLQTLKSHSLTCCVSHCPPDPHQAKGFLKPRLLLRLLVASSAADVLSLHRKNPETHYSHFFFVLLGDKALVQMQLILTWPLTSCPSPLLRLMSDLSSFTSALRATNWYKAKTEREDRVTATKVSRYTGLDSPPEPLPVSTPAKAAMAGEH